MPNIKTLGKNEQGIRVTRKPTAWQTDERTQANQIHYNLSDCFFFEKCGYSYDKKAKSRDDYWILDKLQFPTIVCYFTDDKIEGTRYRSGHNGACTISIDTDCKSKRRT